MSTFSLTFQGSSIGSVTLPILENSSDPITFTINWGDGVTDSLLTHNYGSVTGPYTAVLSITSGSVSRFGLFGWTGGDKLIQVATNNNNTWGLPGVTSFQNAFAQCTALISVPLGIPSSVTNMNNMFISAFVFNQNINTWDVSNVTNMIQMFAAAFAFDQPLNNWNVSNVNTMEGMFTSAIKFNQPLNNWNVSNVTNMQSMFQNIDDFNQDISAWDVSSVTNMRAMFLTSSVFNQDISAWDVSSVTDMQQMFENARLFNQNIRNWNTNGGPVGNYTQMFKGASRMISTYSGETGFGTNPDYTPTASFFNVVSTLSLTFQDANAIGSVTLPIVENSGDPITYTIIWGDGTTDSLLTHDYGSVTGPFTAVVNIVSGSVTQFGDSIPWSGGNKLTAVATNNNTTWGLPGVTSFENAFINCSTLVSVPLVVPSSVTNMNNMFSGASVFNQDIGNWDVSSVVTMSEMFFDAIGFDKDIGNWNVGSVTNMSYMFQNAQAFDQLLDNWNVTSVANMEGMFQNAQTFDKSLNNWNVGSVTNMSNMFQNAPLFNQPLDNWNVGSVTNMSNMFQNAPLFNQNIRDWNTNGGPVADYTEMFKDASAMISTYSGETGFGTSPDYTPTSTFFNFIPSLSLTFQDASAIGSITLPIEENSGDPIIFTIDWGDGTTDSLLTHDYGSVLGPFTAVVTITGGSVTRFGLSTLSGWDGVDKLTAVATNDLARWGLPGVTSFENVFRFASKLTSVPTGIPSSVTNMNNMLSRTSSFNQNIGSWNVSNVTNMDGMFAGAPLFDQDIGGWDVSNVTDMRGMFLNAIAFNQDIGGWNVSNVIDMGYMFSNAENFDHFIGNWDVSNVTDMEGMFARASQYNKDIGDWDVSNVTTMRTMFDGARLFNNGGQPLTWSTKTSNVTDMSSMFRFAVYFNQNIGDFDVSSVTDMGAMFNYADSFHQNIGSWDVSSVTNMSYMFQYAFAFDQYIRNWSTNGGPVTDYLDMFEGATAMISTYSGITGFGRTPTSDFFNLNISFNLSLTFQDSSSIGSVTLPIIENSSDPITFTINWGDGTIDSLLTHNYGNVLGPFTAEVNITGGSVIQFGSSSWSGSEKLIALATNDNTRWGLPGLISLEYAFVNAVTLTSVPTGVPSSVTNMAHMFNGASVFNQDISSWNVSNVTNMSNMFFNAQSFDQDINIWDVSSVTNMSYMFSGANVFDQDLSSWIVSNVNNMTSMFSNTDFNQDIGGWDVSNVTNMNNMFSNAALFNQDLSTWNVSNVTNMSYMFRLTSFNKDITSWNVSNVISMSGMFFNAQSFDQDINIWDVSSVTNMSYMFSGANVFDQDIRDWNTNGGPVGDYLNMFEGATAMISTYSGTSGFGTSPDYTPTSEFFNVGPSLGLTFEDATAIGSVTLPIVENSGDPMSFSIDWGDGVIDSSLTHDYGSFAGPFTAVFTITGGSVTQFGGNGWSGADKLTAVSTTANTIWGLPGITSFEYAFNNASKLISVPTRIPSSVTNMSYMFSGASVFNQSIVNWDVSNIINMQDMFNNAFAFNQYIGDWNVSNVTNMQGIFYGASVFDQNIGSWDVTSVNNMQDMFNNAFDNSI